MTEEEVLALFESCSNVGRWGADDQLGTLNLITPDKRLEALRSVRSGRVVSLGMDLHGRPLPPGPVRPWTSAPRYSPVDAHDDLTLRIHGFEVTHMDAPGHVYFEGRVWGGRRADDVARDERPRVRLDRAARRARIVTRGVLLDVAAARGVAHLAGRRRHRRRRPRGGRATRRRDRRARATRSSSARATRVRAAAEGEPTTRARRTRASCPRSLPWLRARDVAVYSGDCIEVRPSGYARVAMPLHQIGLVAMGLCILDCPDVEALASACREEGRSTFALVVAPLRIPGGTGSAVNPLALF